MEADGKRSKQPVRLRVSILSSDRQLSRRSHHRLEIQYSHIHNCVFFEEMLQCLESEGIRLNEIVCGENIWT
jgi:hypothetical protein